MLNSNYSLSESERQHILKRLVESTDNTITFSERLAIDEEFRLYAETKNYDYCIMNFISWLTHSPYAKKLSQVLNATVA